MVAEPLCHVIPVRETCDKFNHKTASKLRKLSKGRKSEVEFWTEIYKHLFDTMTSTLRCFYKQNRGLKTFVVRFGRGYVSYWRRRLLQLLTVLFLIYWVDCTVSSTTWSHF
ncbi:hypothetical protein K4K56_007506 [Colletotrichum sp. SAR 10_98]|nr:hypothetical protein K4K56_007506 [Colletotrichum sp. SAR 10_98]